VSEWALAILALVLLATAGFAGRQLRQKALDESSGTK